MAWRVVGVWRPVGATCLGILLPALLAYALLRLAGVPGALDGGDAVRRAILFVLYALMAAPVLGLLTLPLSVALVLGLVVTGWAGAVSAVLAALIFGLPLVHVALNADLTTEDASVLPHLMVALSIQGLTVWTVLWAMMRRAGGAAERADASQPGPKEGRRGRIHDNSKE